MSLRLQNATVSLRGAGLVFLSHCFKCLWPKCVFIGRVHRWCRKRPRKVRLSLPSEGRSVLERRAEKNGNWNFSFLSFFFWTIRVYAANCQCVAELAVENYIRLMRRAHPAGPWESAVKCYDWEGDGVAAYWWMGHSSPWFCLCWPLLVLQAMRVSVLGEMAFRLDFGVWWIVFVKIGVEKKTKKTKKTNERIWLKRSQEQLLSFSSDTCCQQISRFSVFIEKVTYSSSRKISTSLASDFKDVIQGAFNSPRAWNYLWSLSLSLV